ncbi:LysR family transcriptional regulator [Sphingobium jiangsuense]|uniref:LysR family glycine cleavage system transcriptional activator n=1 Tax=Sphingobium jiangsuense TaxID=870476 RepID=A0A7W6BE86_9SPHN|nr:LysR family transcriptional regulator [Sphingobium jiangsuense]MBB3924499.1 LysR family glycine cleavage system transcriptional activator [Sphingobium jiangsuense]GLT01571.1 LysR family transcriptional regulator [Sphingobium jiangsuense]
MKRTHLPLNGLRVLDAAARHLSFTRAADELAVTPAAVGQQIRALEDMLGVVLFRRTPKGLELTPETEGALEALRNGFLKFEEAVQTMQAGQSSNALTIAAPRDIIATWLMPRLAGYAAERADLHLTLIAADTPPDFTEANLDLAIELTGGVGEHEGVPLDDGRYIVVESATGGAEGWIDWPGSGAPAAEPALIRVADGGLAISAAANGLGRASVPHLLAQGALADGRVRQVGEAQAGKHGYWLIAPAPQWRQKKVRALVEVLTA